MDGSVIPMKRVTPEFLIETYLKDADIAVLRHP